MCTTYLALRDHSGWWNQAKYAKNEVLTPLGFLRLLLRMEFNDYGGTGANNIDGDIQGETVVRNFYTHCRYFKDCTCNPLSASDIFKYASVQQVLGARHDLIIIDKNVDLQTIKNKWDNAEDPGNNTYSGVDFEDYFLHPGNWAEGIGEQNGVKFPDVPFSWGNISMIGKSPTGKLEEAKLYITNNHLEDKDTIKNHFYIVRGMGDSFVIITFNQRVYWYGS
jgi:hypothetical protein